MIPELEKLRPQEIEWRSFELIEQELARPLDPALAPVIRRVIHTTADFDYADTLYFSRDAVPVALELLRGGATIVTDTHMAEAGINKVALKKLGCQVACFMSDADVAAAAERDGTTRAAAAVDKAAALPGRVIFAVGNAPTALIRICERMDEGTLTPAFIIGVPVGFVNVVPAKELVLQSGAPCIVARGRKGGSNVAAAIVNALMYLLTREN